MASQTASYDDFANKIDKILKDVKEMIGGSILQQAEFTNMDQQLAKIVFLTRPKVFLSVNDFARLLKGRYGSSLDLNRMCKILIPYAETLCLLSKTLREWPQKWPENALSNDFPADLIDPICTIDYIIKVWHLMFNTYHIIITDLNLPKTPKAVVSSGTVVKLLAPIAEATAFVPVYERFAGIQFCELSKIQDSDDFDRNAIDIRLRKQLQNCFDAAILSIHHARSFYELNSPKNAEAAYEIVNKLLPCKTRYGMAAQCAGVYADITTRNKKIFQAAGATGKTLLFELSYNLCMIFEAAITSSKFDRPLWEPGMIQLLSSDKIADALLGIADYAIPENIMDIAIDSKIDPSKEDRTTYCGLGTFTVFQFIVDNGELYTRVPYSEALKKNILRLSEPDYVEKLLNAAMQIRASALASDLTQGPRGVCLRAAYVIALSAVDFVALRGNKNLEGGTFKGIALDLMAKCLKTAGSIFMTDESMFNIPSGLPASRRAEAMCQVQSDISCLTGRVIDTVMSISTAAERLGNLRALTGKTAAELAEIIKDLFEASEYMAVMASTFPQYVAFGQVRGAQCVLTRIAYYILDWLSCQSEVVLRLYKASHRQESDKLDELWPVALRVCHTALVGAKIYAAAPLDKWNNDFYNPVPSSGALTVMKALMFLSFLSIPTRLLRVMLPEKAPMKHGGELKDVTSSQLMGLGFELLKTFEIAGKHGVFSNYPSEPFENILGSIVAEIGAELFRIDDNSDLFFNLYDSQDLAGLFAYIEAVEYEFPVQSSACMGKRRENYPRIMNQAAQQWLRGILEMDPRYLNLNQYRRLRSLYEEMSAISEPLEFQIWTRGEAAATLLCAHAGCMSIPKVGAGSLVVKSKRCSGCKKVTYCCAACQKKDWKVHKAFCKGAAESRAAQEEEAAKASN